MFRTIEHSQTSLRTGPAATLQAWKTTTKTFRKRKERKTYHPRYAHPQKNRCRLVFRTISIRTNYDDVIIIKNPLGWVCFWVTLEDGMTTSGLSHQGDRKSTSKGTRVAPIRIAARAKFGGESIVHPQFCGSVLYERIDYLNRLFWKPSNCNVYGCTVLFMMK